MAASAAKARGSGSPKVALLLGVLGVVYGDIGTSPLYTMKASLGLFARDGALSASDVLGVTSLVVWSLILIVTVKYIGIVTRADNKGEGGILALMALATRALPQGRLRHAATMVGIAGASLFVGDGAITPAISVLSAIEGLEVVNPALHPFVVPLSVLVLVGVFAVQYRGSGKVGLVYGPVTFVWFVTLAILGVRGILLAPPILAAVSPTYAVWFFVNHPLESFVALGAIVLAVTGAEALYADMGHFGRRPIVQAWLFCVLPALALNYVGQGALLLADAAALENPFYLLAPSWFRLPLVFLATAATIIASQAMITGAFSIARQMMQLGFCPRLTVRHTSGEEAGQIYIPQVNAMLFIGVMLLVAGFRASENLAAAYGIAVTGTFVCTSLLGLVVARRVLGWSTAKTVASFGLFLVIDLAFFASNLLKVPEGGWVPILIGVTLFTLLTSWRRGRDLLFEKWRADSLPLASFLARLPKSRTIRVPGTAVFMTGNPDYVPGALLHNLKHNKVLHEKVIFLTVLTEEVPVVPPEQRATVEELAPGIHRVILRYGFMESPNIPRALAELKDEGIEADPMQVSFFLGRESVVPAAVPKMSRWRHWLFMVMARNAVSATEFFRIPSDRVVELGVRVAI
ncbi:potassium transporter Kup [Elioraea tepida]|jgi:KUP system potassium uptake protein|uniref:Probable potassium transport system protein Kup n=1 Tax=Elioraea tepida TaxID=2843330 RepID=A0A975U5X0_9PROT|nr:potassium transporter Kup [Elioraea tepida]QXM26028.1 potassium transporter Kup [Elioraea tepida]